MEVTSLGNAFVNASVTIGFIADPSPSELIASPIELLRRIESAPSVKTLKLNSNEVAKIEAKWNLSTNPQKFVDDPNPADESNGLFLIVANGAPGAIVPLKVRLEFDIELKGPRYQPMVPQANLDFHDNVVTGTQSSTVVNYPPIAIGNSANRTISSTATSFLATEDYRADGVVQTFQIIPKGSRVTVGTSVGGSVDITYNGLKLYLLFTTGNCNYSQKWDSSHNYCASGPTV